MSVDRMQSQRFELKYLVTEEAALRIRDMVMCYLNLDEYSACQPSLSYPVHSLYLDSDDLKCYWDTINGNKNRFKLRIRYYSVDAKVPVFFEIKRRVNNCIMKQRGGVRQDAVQKLLSGYLPQAEHLTNPNNAKYLVAIQRFCELVNAIQAKPRVHIAYLREAYVNDTDTVRITIDRAVRAESNLAFKLKTEMKEPSPAFGKDVILELKFTNRHPDWFKELVRIFSVMQCGAAKYVESIQNVGSRKVGSPFSVIEDASYELP